jgi:hypothetical protein
MSLSVAAAAVAAEEEKVQQQDIAELVTTASAI